MNSTKLSIVVPRELKELMNQHKLMRKEDKSLPIMSEVVRQAIAQELKRTGIKVPESATHVVRGGRDHWKKDKKAA